MTDTSALENLKYAHACDVALDLSSQAVHELWAEIETMKKRVAELESAQRWIPVSERLPDKNDTVLVFSANESDSSPAIAVFYDCEWTEWIVNSRFLKSSDVTHWMPQPESPNDTQTDTFVYGKDSKQIPCPFCGEIVFEWTPEVQK